MRLDANGFTQRGWVAIELPLEPGVAGYGERTCAFGAIVGFADRTAEKRRYAKQ